MKKENNERVQLRGLTLNICENKIKYKIEIQKIQIYKKILKPRLFEFLIIVNDSNIFQIFLKNVKRN